MALANFCSYVTLSDYIRRDLLVRMVIQITMFATNIWMNPIANNHRGFDLDRNQSRASLMQKKETLIYKIWLIVAYGQNVLGINIEKLKVNHWGYGMVQ